MLRTDYFWAVLYLSEDSRRSKQADLLNLCHISSIRYFLDVFNHPILYCAKHTNNYKVAMVFICQNLCVLLSLSLSLLLSLSLSLSLLLLLLSKDV